MKVMFIVYHDIRTNARSQEMLECAQKLGNEVVLVSYSTPLNAQNVRCVVTGRGQRRYFPFIFSAIKAIIQNNPKVVILHDNYTSTILRWLYKNRKDIFVIYDSSELYIDRKINSLNAIAASHMRYFEKKYLKHAHVVIAANEERAAIMKNYFQLRETPIVFDNMHRISDSFDNKILDEKYHHVFQEYKFFILYAGGISDKRRTFDLLNAVGTLGDKFKLIICGRASKQELKKLDDIIYKNKWGNIHYIGFVSRAELRYLLRKCHVSVSAFTQDSLNNIYCASGKLYESLFEGTPVLVSSNPPLKRLCQETGVGVSTDDFQFGILQLYNNYDMYCENVEKVISTIDYEGRLNALVNILQSRILQWLGIS